MDSSRKIILGKIQMLMSSRELEDNRQGMILYQENNFSENLGSLSHNLIKIPASLVIYLNQCEKIDPEDFASMLSRCIEQNKEWCQPSFDLLCEYGLRNKIETKLFLVIPYYFDYSEDRMKKAMEYGWEDPFLFDQKLPYPDLDICELRKETSYRGFRHGYHIAKYGDQKNRRELIKRWMREDGKRSYDCTFTGALTALGLAQVITPTDIASSNEITEKQKKVEKILLKEYY